MIDLRVNFTPSINSDNSDWFTEYAIPTLSSSHTTSIDNDIYDQLLNEIRNSDSLALNKIISANEKDYIVTEIVQDINGTIMYTVEEYNPHKYILEEKYINTDLGTFISEETREEFMKLLE